MRSSAIRAFALSSWLSLNKAIDLVMSQRWNGARREFYSTDASLGFGVILSRDLVEVWRGDLVPGKAMTFSSNICLYSTHIFFKTFLRCLQDGYNCSKFQRDVTLCRRLGLNWTNVARASTCGQTGHPLCSCWSAAGVWLNVAFIQVRSPQVSHGALEAESHRSTTKSINCFLMNVADNKGWKRSTAFFVLKLNFKWWQ